MADSGHYAVLVQVMQVMRDNGVGQWRGLAEFTLQQGFLQVGARSFEPARHLYQGQHLLLARYVVKLCTEFGHRLKKYVKALAAVVIASAGRHNQRIIGQRAACECRSHIEYAATGLFAHLGKLRALGHEIVFKAIWQHHIYWLVEQLLALAVGKAAHGCKAVGMPCTLLFNAMFGLHVQFLRHLVAVVAIEVSIQLLVVTAYRAAYAGGMGCKYGCHAGHVFFKEKHTQSRHPLVCLVHHLVGGSQAERHHGLDKATGCIRKHRCLIIVAIGVE